MPEEPDVSPEEMEILDRVWRKRVEAKKRLHAYEVRLIANRILEALRSRPEGLTWEEIREMFDRKFGTRQIRQALLTLETSALTTTKAETNGDHSGERWFLLAASEVT
jgi:hypothetical protein